MVTKQTSSTNRVQLQHGNKPVEHWNDTTSIQHRCLKHLTMSGERWRRTDDGVCFSNTSFAPILSQISSAVKRVCYAEERKKGTGRSDLFNRRAKGTLVFSILLNSSNSYSKRCKVDTHASLPQIAPNLPNRLETGLSVILKEYIHLHQRRIKNASIGYVGTNC